MRARREGWENADSCATKRDRAGQLARHDWKRALSMANSIDLMWYRVQALTHVVREAPDEQVDALLDRCITEAGREQDRYRGIGVLAWVIDAARERGRHRRASQMLAHALSTSDTIQPLMSRGAALELLIRSASALSPQEHAEACRVLLEVAHQMQRSPYKRMRKWCKTYIGRVVYSLATVDREMAHRLIAKRFDGATADRALSKI